ncbi:MAG: tRNA (adenosine(37)-N6)-threonylcarbamoyltransferase complex dimerization subunit type 1 TsaB [Chthoniobacterales bacterium]
MRILAIENSTSNGSIAVLCNGELEFEESFSAPRGRGSLLFEVLQRCFETCSKPDRIAIGTGPGSYNGIRIALAAGKGLELGGKADFVAFSSALCLPVEASDYVYFGDARGGQFHLSVISNRTFREEPRLLAPDELERALAACGVSVFSDTVHEKIYRGPVVNPSARILAELAVLASPENGMPEPLYLKPPHITVPRSSQHCIQPSSE